jgi:hypothetical protein
MQRFPQTQIFFTMVNFLFPALWSLLHGFPHTQNN